MTSIVLSVSQIQIFRDFVNISKNFIDILKFFTNISEISQNSNLFR
jgi:hypothetical protein